MKIIVRFDQPNSGGAVVATALHDYEQNRPVARAALSDPVKALDELGEWAERWDMPGVRAQLTRELDAHRAALAKHETELIARLSAVHAQRDKVDA